MEISKIWLYKAADIRIQCRVDGLPTFRQKNL